MDTARPLKFIICCYLFHCHVWKNFCLPSCFSRLHNGLLGFVNTRRIIFYLEIVLKVLSFYNWMGRCSSGDKVLLKDGFDTVCRFYTMLRELHGNLLAVRWLNKTIITLLVGRLHLIQWKFLISFFKPFWLRQDLHTSCECAGQSGSGLCAQFFQHLTTSYCCLFMPCHLSESSSKLPFAKAV